jgi:oxygen-independent coproporphyrinogen-3 oxidase
VSPRLPDGEPAPRDGALPARALATLGARPFGVYVHVPFCASRCGYCDFNTYVPRDGIGRAGFAASVLAEWELARGVLGGAPPPAATVFFGGGTPTLLDASALVELLAAIDDAFGLADGAEVTTEANPESVSVESLRELRAGGFTRVSLGMQSAAPHVLATLDRQHTPGRAAAAAREARVAGFDHVSLDLIYGTPGESDADWLASLDAALAASPDHLALYGLTVEPGTALAARVRRGAVPSPDDEAQARRYRLAEERLAAAGLDWYEVCSWAADADAVCRHNIGYWRSHDWWGIGPGAHSHVGGVRWWNVLRPAAYAARLADRSSPAAGREVLDERERHLERVMLELRLRSGLALDVLDAAGTAAARRQSQLGRLSREAFAAGRAVLTLEGRLFADAVARELTG